MVVSLSRVLWTACLVPGLRVVTEVAIVLVRGLATYGIAWTSAG